MSLSFKLLFNFSKYLREILLLILGEEIYFRIFNEILLIDKFINLSVFLVIKLRKHVAYASILLESEHYKIFLYCHFHELKVAFNTLRIFRPLWV